uniref:Uncharacterized protein n=1 Tax=Malurus cyaneus samueli TaxID=2593467 RepID=A0A8C5TCF9_9PASS
WRGCGSTSLSAAVSRAGSRPRSTNMDMMLSGPLKGRNNTCTSATPSCYLGKTVRTRHVEMVFCLRRGSR